MVVVMVVLVAQLRIMFTPTREMLGIVSAKMAKSAGR